MEIGDVATWGSVVVAVAVGAAGFVTALIANARARAAVEQAKVANAIAQRANGIAESAVRTADAANTLSEEANAISLRGSALLEEDWFVSWQHNWDIETNTLQFRNTGKDAARALTMNITGPDLHRVTTRSEAVEPGQTAEVTLKEISERRAATMSANESTRAAMSEGIIVMPRAFSQKIQVRISWKTGHGFPQVEELEMVLK